MLELKYAIKKSFQYLELMYEGQELPNKLLEEIEYDDNADIWKVVIGFDSNRITTTTEGSECLNPCSVPHPQLRKKNGITNKSD